MIELFFRTGSEIANFKIENKRIFFLGKPTGYSYVEWNPIRSADQLSRLRIKKGDEWMKEYLDAEEKFNSYNSEEEIANDLIDDMQKKGMELIKKEVKK